jgi:arylsulfatase A-like enzyme
LVGLAPQEPKTAVIRVFALVLFALLGAASLLTARPPNVVLFLVDDLGWRDVGCQGSQVFATPAADKLAREGARFTQACAACPVCSPSRAALMTGKAPARAGFTGHITATGKHRYPPKGRVVPLDDHWNLPLNERTVAEMLREAGYATANVGKRRLGAAGAGPEVRSEAEEAARAGESDLCGHGGENG